MIKMDNSIKKFVNPYIEKVISHKNIISYEEEAFKNKSKWNDYFQNNNSIILEIWTWLWNFFSNEVSKNQESNFIWIEIKFKRIFVTAEKTLNKNWKNFVLVKTDWKNISRLFWNEEISLTYIFFPDPWDKKDYQRKNRLIDEDFLLNLFNITKVWWSFIFKTDHEWYFKDVVSIVEKIWIWKINKISFDYENEIESFDKKNLTEFESIFREHRLKINYLELKK